MGFGWVRWSRGCSGWRRVSRSHTSAVSFASLHATCGLTLLQIAPSDNLILAGEHAGDGFGVGDVLLLEDAGGEGVRIVALEDGDGALQDDDAMVELLVDEVHGAAGDLHSVFEGLHLRVEPGEGGQQRGVDVEDALRKGLDESGRE